jgi:hypothetical protein
VIQYYSGLGKGQPFPKARRSALQHFSQSALWLLKC